MFFDYCEIHPKWLKYFIDIVKSNEWGQFCDCNRLTESLINDCAYVLARCYTFVS